MDRVTDLDSPAVWSALAYEIEGTWSLLGQSERMLRDLRVVTDYDPLFACLATGAEKLLKIVHGLVIEHEQGQWPTKNTMSNTYRHTIVKLDGVCRGHVRDRLPTATSPGYIGGLLAEVDDDLVIRDLIEAVDRYARGGRFHNLDTLAEGPPDHPSPRVRLETLELAIWEREGLVGQLGKDQPTFDAALAQGNLVLRGSLLRWWDLYYRAAQHGVLGPRAKQWFSTGSPPTP